MLNISHQPANEHISLSHRQNYNAAPWDYRYVDRPPSLPGRRPDHTEGLRWRRQAIPLEYKIKLLTYQQQLYQPQSTHHHQGPLCHHQLQLYLTQYTQAKLHLNLQPPNAPYANASSPPVWERTANSPPTALPWSGSSSAAWYSASAPWLRLWLDSLSISCSGSSCGFFYSSPTCFSRRHGVAWIVRVITFGIGIITCRTRLGSFLESFLRYFAVVVCLVRVSAR